MYDESGHLLGEYDGAGNLVQETVWLGDIPVATLRPGTPVGIYYVHTDHLDQNAGSVLEHRTRPRPTRGDSPQCRSAGAGCAHPTTRWLARSPRERGQDSPSHCHTPRLVTQPSNNAVRWSWNSDAFGTNPPNANPSGLGTFVYNLRFPGQQYDGLAGLYYNYFRDYDAATGRYVESDPIGLDGGINTYAYVSSDPLRRSDYFGLEPARLCENYDGLKKQFCDTCVKTVCSLTGASQFCCMVEFNECIFKNDDERGQLICSAKLEACNLKKSKGPKKPPKDI